ncbi:3'-phosphoesterase [archaeon]|nr:3'-phosphoesterase [archaeon]
MGLEKYKKIRDFEKTSEPAGGVGSGDEALFVVQKHDASSLHYDLRLSFDGVLKSWAVPKEPPTKTGVKRLAIMTEDHPLTYATFEGTIPKGQYGGGTVEIYDSGTFELEEREDKKIVFVLKGRKLSGKYVLLKFQKAGDNGWLFFKAD